MASSELWIPPMGFNALRRKNVLTDTLRAAMKPQHTADFDAINDATHAWLQPRPEDGPPTDVTFNYIKVDHDMLQTGFPLLTPDITNGYMAVKFVLYAKERDLENAVETISLADDKFLKGLIPLGKIEYKRERDAMMATQRALIEDVLSVRMQTAQIVRYYATDDSTYSGVKPYSLREWQRAIDNRPSSIRESPVATLDDPVDEATKARLKSINWQYMTKLFDCYDAHDYTNLRMYCPILRKYTDEATLSYFLDGNVMRTTCEMLFGRNQDHHASLHNGLVIHKDFARLIALGKAAIVPKTASDSETQFIFVLLTADIGPLSGQIDLSVEELNGRELRFLTDFRPSKAYLCFKYAATVLSLGNPRFYGRQADREVFRAIPMHPVRALWDFLVDPPPPGSDGGEPYETDTELNRKRAILYKMSRHLRCFSVAEANEFWSIDEPEDFAHISLVDEDYAALLSLHTSCVYHKMREASPVGSDYEEDIEGEEPHPEPQADPMDVHANEQLDVTGDVVLSVEIDMDGSGNDGDIEDAGDDSDDSDGFSDDESSTASEDSEDSEDAEDSEDSEDSDDDSDDEDDGDVGESNQPNVGETPGNGADNNDNDNNDIDSDSSCTLDFESDGDRRASERTPRSQCRAIARILASRQRRPFLRRRRSRSKSPPLSRSPPRDRSPLRPRSPPRSSDDGTEDARDTDDERQRPIRSMEQWPDEESSRLGDNGGEMDDDEEMNDDEHMNDDEEMDGDEEDEEEEKQEAEGDIYTIDRTDISKLY